MSVEICGLVIKWQLIGFLVAVLVYVTLVTVARACIPQTAQTARSVQPVHRRAGRLNLTPALSRTPPAIAKRKAELNKCSMDSLSQLTAGLVSVAGGR